MSVQPQFCPDCRRECVFDRMAPYPGKGDERTYGVGWRCPQCFKLSLDVCPVGPLVPSDLVCLYCGTAYPSEVNNSACDVCGLSRRRGRGRSRRRLLAGRSARRRARRLRQGTDPPRSGDPQPGAAARSEPHGCVVGQMFLSRCVGVRGLKMHDVGRRPRRRQRTLTVGQPGFHATAAVPTSRGDRRVSALSGTGPVRTVGRRRLL